MSRPQFVPIKLEDFPVEHQEMLEPLLRQLNNVIGTHNQILNKGLSIKDNVNSITNDQAITPVQGGGFPKVTIKNTLAGKPQHVLISSATDAKGNPLSLGNPAWKVNGNGDIEISAINGLDTTQVSNLRFLVLGG
jgi:hypothetical protein